MIFVFGSFGFFGFARLGAMDICTPVEPQICVFMYMQVVVHVFPPSELIMRLELVAAIKLSV